MKNESNLLLKLISENKSLNEISSILGLSNKQLFTRLSMLRNSGYLFDREYSYNGEINYSFHNPFIKDNIPTIKIPQNTNTIKVMVISDTHLGHIDDSIECIDSMYNYCAKEGINIILHAGDFFEGIYTERKKQCKFDSAVEQINYGLNNYPYEKNILNFILLGNHDATFLTKTGIDIQEILLNRRHDLIPIGYGESDISIGNFTITMRHQISNVKMKSDVDNKLFLYGHGHSFSTNCDTGHTVLFVHIPALSYVQTKSNGNSLPSMIEMNLTISNEFISKECFKHFIFDQNNNPICISEINYCTHISPYKVETQNEKIVPSIFEKSKKLTKTKPNYKGMSQLEKFNAKYNI